MTEAELIWEKMMAGEIYDASHPSLIEKLKITREKIWEYNMLRPSQEKEMKAILHDLLGAHGDVFQFNQPFRCDYGENIFIGEGFFANFNLTILDEAEVRIGDNVFIGPNVSIYTACHPLDAPSRNTLVEWAEPVTIGNNVWIGGSATILPGVTIGDNTVIGGGSVVTKDIPANVMAAGNPARIIKRLDDGAADHSCR
ncbi:MAG: sugar O-acetyltransferase [Muribaculaceae bacterium]|nr:sugar O-acetyltransferase [Muribaculaceae bacterium]